MSKTTNKVKTPSPTERNKRANEGATKTVNGVEYISVKNLMSGVWVWQEKDTPWSCRVDSETYWCS